MGDGGGDRSVDTMRSMPDSYFTTDDGARFVPTDHCRGPWDPGSCHAGPPTGLMVRALERLVPHHRLARITVELMRPIPMAGFGVQAEIRRPGRSVTWSSAEILDEDLVYARAHATHVRVLDAHRFETVETESPSFSAARPGSFPIRTTTHGERGFADSIEVRYDPSGSQGEGGPTVMWMRTLVPLLADEEPSGFQRISPLADCGNGISWNEYLDRVRFVNPDLHVSLHREPEGEWFCSSSRSHWAADGTGTSDSELFDTAGPVGRAIQSLLLDPVET